MGFFDRFKPKKATQKSAYERASALGTDPKAWAALSNPELKRVILVKCIEYGVSADPSRIPLLFALYKYFKGRSSRSERSELLNEFSKMTEDQKGQGHMGLMMFLAAEDDPAICSSAAMSLAVLFDPRGGDALAGPKHVVGVLLTRAQDGELQGRTLGGILLLGDKRILPLLLNAWAKLSEDARLGLTKAKSGYVYACVVEFWLRCLEDGCSESVFGSIVAAIAKMPAIAEVPFVLDVERVLPAYKDSENPLKLIRRTSFKDYLAEIRPRLDALERKESEPKLIPRIYDVWNNPEQFKGVIG